jgi:hypothetical protein
MYSITTTGYGSLPNPTNGLRILSIVAMVSGAFLADGGITACLTKFISTIDSQDSNSKRDKECAFIFMSTVKIQHNLKALVDKFYTSSLSNGDEDYKTLDLIPLHFRPEIVSELALVQTNLSSVPLLQSFNFGMIRTLTYCIKPEIFSPGDILLKAGIEADRMYFIVQGEVQKITNRFSVVPAKNGRDDVTSISSGCVGGNKIGIPEKFTYKAITFVDTFLFTHSDYHKIVSSIASIGGLYDDMWNLLADNAGLMHIFAFCFYSFTFHSSWCRCSQQEFEV